MLAVAALGLAVLSLAPAQAAVEYSITHIGQPPEGGSQSPTAINDAGQISTGAYQPPWPSYRWTKGIWQNLGSLGDSTLTLAYAINGQGHVAGESSVVVNESGSTEPRAFLWKPGTGIINLGHLGTAPTGYNYSYAHGVNDEGKVVGYTIVGEFAYHAFVWQDTNANDQSDPGEMVDLTPWVGQEAASRATGISPNGWIAGWSSFKQSDGTWTASGFRRTPEGTMLRLRVLAYDLSINDFGDVAGWTVPEGMWADRAYIVLGSTQYTLGTFGGPRSWAQAINRSRTVVGRAEELGGNQLGFVWDRTRGMRKLNDLIPANSGWSIVMPAGINTAGHIVGWGYRYGVISGFILKRDTLTTAPLRPFWVEQTHSSGEQLTARWDEPVTIGLRGVQRYRVQVKEDSRSFTSPTFTVDVPITEPAAEYSRILTATDGLRSGHWYSFRVAAVGQNPDGTEAVGPYSAASPLAAYKMGAIIGTIYRNSDYLPVNGAKVEALAHGTSTVVRTVFTDLGGRYILPALPVGSYSLRISHPDLTTLTDTNSTNGYEVSENGYVPLDEYVAPTAVGSLWGIVLGAGNTPLGGATVKAIKGAQTFTTTSAYNGRYTFGRLAPGNWQVMVSAPGYQDHSQQATVATGLSARVNTPLTSDGSTPPPAEKGSITGSVSDTLNIRLANVRVVVAGPVNVETFATTEGLFAIGNLPPGSYTVSVFKNGYSAGAAPKTVTAGADVGQGFRLAPLSVIEGQVTVNGAAANAFKVDIRGGGVVHTDPLGNYRLSVPARTYNVIAAYDRTIVTPVTTTAGNVSTVNFPF
jgi:probable HAF family extracellular repeat protein